MLRRFFCALLAVCVFISAVPAADIETDAAGLSFVEYLAEGVEDSKGLIDITRYVNNGGWSKDEIKSNILNFYVSQPELFYISNTFNIKYGNNKYYVLFDYLYSEKEISSMQEEMEKAALNAIAAIDDDMTDEQKALIVHDYLILNCEYDYSLKNYTAYDCLVKKKAVCQGYTLAYIYILENYLGIKCTAVVSESQNHAWNYVNIGNSWYHVDLTADDASYSDYSGKSYDAVGKVMHENFLLSDSAAKKSSGLHRNWRIVGGFPKAADTRYDNYYWRDVSSQIIEYNGKWYYCKGITSSSDNKLYSGLYCYNPSTGKSTRLKSIDTKWYPSRNPVTGKTYKYGESWYSSSFSRLLLIDGKFYINSSKCIFRYDPSTGKMKKIYTLNKGETQQIYSIVQNGKNKIRICYKPDLTYSDNFLTLKLK
ncbi:MAG: transglutaminase domain-containing protein [Ruminiclostridium sp.]